MKSFHWISRLKISRFIYSLNKIPNPFRLNEKHIFFLKDWLENLIFFVAKELIHLFLSSNLIWEYKLLDFANSIENCNSINIFSIELMFMIAYIYCFGRIWCSNSVGTFRENGPNFHSCILHENTTVIVQFEHTLIQRISLRKFVYQMWSVQKTISNSVFIYLKMHMNIPI